jgi:hypothetical protein
LGKCTAILSFFSPRFKSTMEIILPTAVEYYLWFPLVVRHCFKMSSLQFNFQFGKQSKITRGLLAFSHSSRHTFTCCCFWSIVKGRGTNFAAMFKYSVKISFGNSVTDINGTCELMDCSAMTFIDAQDF